jgi:Kdo2-lipid IVA lauroyltransferase/acyltransferase
MISWKHTVEYKAFLGIARIVHSLSPAATVRLGRALGYVTYYFLPIRKKVALDNLRVAFPEKTRLERRRIARRVYANVGQTFFEFLRSPIRSKDELHRRVTFYNKHLLYEAFKSEKGTILLTGHFGNWEIMAAAICALGFPIVVIGKRQRNRLADEIINDYRRAVGIETVPLGMGLRQFLRALKQNKFVAILADQDAHREGIFVDFFNRPSATAPGLALLSLKTGAQIIFGSCVIEKKGRYSVYLERIPTEDLDDADDQSIITLTQRHVHGLEEKIRQWPDHWFWMHKRWKTNPGD